MSEPVPVLLAEAMSDGSPLLFLSPHLDDAVLSCGALMGVLARHSQVRVVTIFSAAGPPPHTRATGSFLRQCAARDAVELYAARQREDTEVLRAVGAEPVHLDVADALFRRRELARPLARAGRLVPELVHRYPTFRYDIARGRVSAGDRHLLARLHERIGQLIDDVDPAAVFVPLGVGRHVDHLLTRSVGVRYAARAIFYSDFPYDQSQSPDPAFLAAHRLRPWTWDGELSRKRELIRGYRTQVDALFPSGNIPVTPERYFLTSDDSVP